MSYIVSVYGIEKCGERTVYGVCPGNGHRLFAAPGRDSCHHCDPMISHSVHDTAVEGAAAADDIDLSRLFFPAYIYYSNLISSYLLMIF